MFEETRAFSGFSVDDIPAAKSFYSETLGLPVSESNGMLRLQLATGGHVLVYPKGSQHTPATFTVLNFPVSNIDSAVDALNAKGIEMLRYPNSGQDDKGIGRAGGPPIAWFTDPAGNILSVLED